MNMNRKVAFKILNLNGTASLEDAKKAYRDLAKKFHPDVVKKNQPSERNAEAKMKEINLAFYYLAPQLISKETIKKPPLKNFEKKIVEETSATHDKKNPFSFLSNISRLVLRFFNKENNSKSHRSTAEKEKRHKQSKEETIIFADIFKSVHKDMASGRKMPNRNKRRPYSKKTDSYMRYQKYMAMKRKIQAGQNRKNQDISIGRVQKIDPIKPVNPDRNN